MSLLACFFILVSPRIWLLHFSQALVKPSQSYWCIELLAVIVMLDLRVQFKAVSCFSFEYGVLVLPPIDQEPGVVQFSE